MGHMLPPDDDTEYKPRDEMKEVNRSSLVQFFTRLVILMGIVILVMLLKDYLEKSTDSSASSDNPYSHNGEQSTLDNGSSLGGAMGGAGDNEMPTPESLARQIKGGGMKVMISGPNGGQQIIEVSPERLKALSKPVGGDTTEATPVGGAGGGD